LTVAIVNPTEKEQELAFDLKGEELTGKGQLQLIANNDPMAYNESGEEPRVRIVEKAVDNVTGKLKAPALSISLYKFPVK